MEEDAAGAGVAVVVGVVVVAVHALAPTEDHEPAGHLRQVLTFVAPALLEYLPASHGMHPIASFCPSYMER